MSLRVAVLFTLGEKEKKKEEMKEGKEEERKSEKKERKTDLKCECCSIWHTLWVFSGAHTP